MSAHVHWWLAAVSFALGMVLTFTLTARPAKTQMPAWVLAEPRPRPKPEPAMKTPAAEAPTKKMPAAQPKPKPRTNATSAPTKKKAASKAPPRKRRPVSGDAATERIPVAKDPATERIPVAGKRPAKKVAAKAKARPKGPATRRRPIPKDAATEKVPVSETPTTVIPLIPYAPYGPGSMRANPDGSGPEGWMVKGRMDSRLFYAPDDACYDDTEAQVWFENEEFAARAFFTPWRNSARKS